MTPSTKKNSASGIHGRSARRSEGVKPGAMNAQSWYSRTGIATMIPTATAMRSVTAKASPGPSVWSGRALAGSGAVRNRCRGSAARNPIAVPNAIARIERMIRVRSSVR